MGSFNSTVEDYGIYGYLPKNTDRLVNHPQKSSTVKVERKQRYLALASLTQQFEAFGQKWGNRQRLLDGDAKRVEILDRAVSSKSRAFLAELVKDMKPSTQDDLSAIVTK